MPGGVRLDCDIAGLAEALARRGVAIDPRAAALATDRPGARDQGSPIILIVADVAQVTAALDAGADDAVLATSPPDEIAARIAARLRFAAPPIGVGELVIDRIARTVTRAGRAVRLLPREYALLVHLAEHAPRVVPRSVLLEAVWGLRFDPGTNVVAVHVSRLRAKLDREFGRPMLHTEKGVGYRLAAA